MLHVYVIQVSSVAGSAVEIDPISGFPACSAYICKLHQLLVIAQAVSPVLSSISSLMNIIQICLMISNATTCTTVEISDT